MDTHAYGSHRATLGEVSSYLPQWGIELKELGFAASAFTYWTISTALIS